MLDYSNKDNKHLFIINYYIDEKNGTIEIRYANGLETEVPDNKTNRMIIDNKMKSQVEEALNKKTIKELSLFLGVSSIALLLALNIFEKNMSNQDLQILNLLFSGVSIGFITNYLVKLRKTKELKKLKYFIENRDRLNEYIDCNNITIGVNPSKFNNIDNSIDKTFNFNTIDKFSYKDITTIDKNINREETLKFDYKELKRNI